mgnify:CR=1 FL=1
MFNTNFLDRERSLFVEILKSFLLLPYKGALCSGPSSAAYIKFLGFNKRKITDYGFNTINHLRFTDTSEQVNSKKNYFLFIGRMDSKKNVVFLLNAYAEYCERIKTHALPLHLIGDGPELANIKALATPNVEFVGYQEQDSMVQLIQNAKAFVFAAFEDHKFEAVGFRIGLNID